MDLGDSFFLHLEREVLCGEPHPLTYFIDQETRAEAGVRNSSGQASKADTIALHP